MVRDVNPRVETPTPIELHAVGFEELCRRQDRRTPSRRFAMSF